ncbi:MAG: hypothetical protein G8345_09740 [Magnetococcales bacterium]|nr:hypothetical protein [Magnetococcales bacterium]NGZ27153.1 hypothetical protein [Magnetococcales bacterium]
MINYLQNTSNLGTQNFLQQQAVQARVPEDIRTNNAEQLAVRNVEQAKNAGNTKEAEANTKKKEEEEKGQDDKDKAIIPPPPSRFQLQVKENTERVNKTQQAVTQFFLSAATSAAMLGDNPSSSATEQGGNQHMSVDVVA